jgi:hypothetical protein
LPPSKDGKTYYMLGCMAQPNALPFAKEPMLLVRDVQPEVAFECLDGSVINAHGDGSATLTDANGNKNMRVQPTLDEEGNQIAVLQDKRSVKTSAQGQEITFRAEDETELGVTYRPLAKPVRFKKIWEDKGVNRDEKTCEDQFNVKKFRCVVWQPVPPPGYVALGCFVTVSTLAGNHIHCRCSCAYSFMFV